MEKFVDYYWEDKKGMFVKLKGHEEYSYVWLELDDLEHKDLGIIINHEIYDKDNNKDEFWWLLEKLLNYDITRYIRGKIEEYFIENGFEIIRQERGVN